MTSLRDRIKGAVKGEDGSKQIFIIRGNDIGLDKEGRSLGIRAVIFENLNPTDNWTEHLTIGVYTRNCGEAYINNAVTTGLAQVFDLK